MKIYFISNPTAGSGKKQQEFNDKFNLYIKSHPNDTIVLHETIGPGDAQAYSSLVANENRGEVIKIYACGGDGTMSDVINGIALHDNVIFGIIPTGSCNDFLKLYPQIDFFDLELQHNAKVFDIDLVKVEDFYGLNVINIGFDAKVNYDQICFRSSCKTVKQAYDKAILHNLIRPLGDNVEVIADNKKIFSGKSLLMAFGNGGYYGGGYNCAPKVILDDGLLDYQIVKKIGILKFIGLVGKYKKGLLYDNPNFKDGISGRAKVFEIKSDKALTVCVDGETLHLSHVKIECLRKKIHFNLPVLN